MNNDLTSIALTAQRCKQEGIPLSETALRRLVKCGQIPAVVIGSKSLLLWDNVLKLIERGNSSAAFDQSGTIRKIG